MSRTVACVTLTVLGALAVPEIPAAQGPAELPLSGGGTPLIASDGILRDRLTHIARRSASWREDVARLVGTGRRVFVLTPAQVVVAEAVDDTNISAFDPTLVAAAAPVPGPDSAVRTVLVVVNLALIEELHQRLGSLPAQFLADLDQVLVHEIYGHALPYLLAGDLSGRCPDPQPGQHASEACSIQRENTVREELRLRRRNGYGLEGLALARSGRDWSRSRDAVHAFLPTAQ